MGNCLRSSDTDEVDRASRKIASRQEAKNTSASSRSDDIEEISAAKSSTSSSARPDGSMIRLFMVGNGEVGKSTIIKQIQKLCLIRRKGYEMFDQNWQPVEPFSPAVLATFRSNIHHNVLRMAAILIQQANRFGYEYPNESRKQWAKEILEHAGNDPNTVHMRSAAVTEELAKKIDGLWHDPGSPLQKAMTRRREFFISDSTEYFLSSAKLYEISRPDYVPSADDIIRARDPTTGVTDYNFRMHKVRFSIHDMGGQPVEMKRLPSYLASWLRRSKPGDRNFVLYVAALSDYNQRHPKYPDKTLLDDSIALFKVLLNMRELENCRFLIFLNKKDVFKAKLQEYNDLERYFGHLMKQCNQQTGKKAKKRKEIQEPDAEDVIASCFAEALNDTAKYDEPLYCRFTCAVDTELMESIFVAVKNDIVHDLISNGSWMPFP